MAQHFTHKSVRLLEYWHKIEFFTPAEIDENKVIRILQNTELPWNNPQDDVLFYIVYLGTFLVSEGNDVIGERIGKRNPDLNPNFDVDIKGERAYFCQLRLIIPESL